MPKREAVEELLDLLRDPPRSLQEVTARQNEIAARVRSVDEAERNDAKSLNPEDPEHWRKAREAHTVRALVFDPTARRRWVMAVLSKASEIRQAHHAMATRYHFLRGLQMDGALTPTLLAELKWIHARGDTLVEAAIKLPDLRLELRGPSLSPPDLVGTYESLRKAAAGLSTIGEVKHRPIRAKLQALALEVDTLLHGIEAHITSDGWDGLLAYARNTCGD